jgi:hypothetical protein
LKGPAQHRSLILLQQWHLLEMTKQSLKHTPNEQARATAG